MTDSISLIVLLGIAVLIALLVEELTVLEVIVGIVTGEGVGRHLGICVSEVDISHIFGVMEEIWVQSIIVPGIMRIIFTLPMTFSHKVGCPCNPEANVSPE